jgi:hypothetical protein
MLSTTNGRTARALALVIAAALACVVAAPATARVFKGTSKANRVSGTKKADKMRLGGGNDRANGRGGNDRISGGSGKDRLSGASGKDRLTGGSGKDVLSGGAGNDVLSGGAAADKLTGGKGADRFSGGAGNDRLDSVDKARDIKIDAGSGRNTCRIDSADLQIVKGCSTLTVVNGSGLGGAGGGGQSLVLERASGLSCGSNVPTCTFSMNGTGADSAAGVVTGGGGAQLSGGAAVSVNAPEWSASGAYGCTADGYLRVAIGSRQIDVPVDCTA